MKLMSKMMAMACALFMLGAVVSCSDDDDDDSKRLPEIGVSLNNPSNGWRKAMGFYATANLESKMVEYKVVASETVEKQAEEIRKMTSENISVLVVVAETGLGAAEINAAIQAQIPVILGEQLISGVTGYTSLVKFDNNLVGKEAAQYMADQGAKKIIALEVAQGGASVSGARINSFIEKMGELDADATIDKYPVENYAKQDGKEIIARLLEEDLEFDAVYAQDDEIALGVLEAIKEANNTTITVIVGCGGAQDYFKAIQDNPEINLATTLYSPKALMEKCIDIADIVLKGSGSFEKEFTLPATVISVANVKDYIDANSPY